MSSDENFAFRKVTEAVQNQTLCRKLSQSSVKDRPKKTRFLRPSRHLRKMHGEHCEFICFCDSDTTWKLMRNINFRAKGGGRGWMLSFYALHLEPAPKSSRWVSLFFDRKIYSPVLTLWTECMGKGKTARSSQLWCAAPITSMRSVHSSGCRFTMPPTSQMSRCMDTAEANALFIVKGVWMTQLQGLYKARH